MGIARGASAAALLSAAIATGCSNGHRAGAAAQASNASSADRRTDRAGALSVTVFRIRGWHNGSYHYMPTLSVTVPSTAGAVLVQRVDFTADDAGVRRLLRGVRYAAERHVKPGGTVDLVSDAGVGELLEIDSPLALASVAAFVFYTDDEGQSGVISATAMVPQVTARPPKHPTRAVR
jgi:hypothetical protein